MKRIVALVLSAIILMSIVFIFQKNKNEKEERQHEEFLSMYGDTHLTKDQVDALTERILDEAVREREDKR